MSKPRSIAIIGAGIGGLTAAAAMMKLGMDVTVYEQAPQFARVGAGIQMSPNAMKCLRGIGLEDRLVDTGLQPLTSLNVTHDTGEVTNELPLREEMFARYGAPFLCLHRADLHHALHSAVPDSAIVRGARLSGLVQDDNGVELSFAEGRTAWADLVIGADGVHSRVQQEVIGAVDPVKTGRVAYRATYPAALLGDLRLNQSRTKWWGPDRHIVIYYTTKALDEVYFCTNQPEDVSWSTPESWSAEGDLEYLKAEFAHFHPEVRAVIAAAPKVHKWALLVRDPLPIWHANRLVLLGDACHPMLPHMAQGASCAIEDAVVLARALAAFSDHRQAFAHYEAVRKPRASEMQLEASQNKWMQRRTDPSWVYGYDAWSTPLEPETELA